MKADWTRQSATAPRTGQRYRSQTGGSRKNTWLPGGSGRESGIRLPVTLEPSDLAFAGSLLAVAAAIAVVPAVWAYRQSPATALRG